MTFQHADLARPRGKYCRAGKCVLCHAAARLTLTGYSNPADDLLNIRNGQMVDASAQSELVRGYLANATALVELHQVLAGEGSPPT